MFHIFLSFAITPSRRKWGPFFPSGRRYWMKSSATTAFKITTASRRVISASTILVSPGVLIVPKYAFIAHLASFNGTSTYPYIVLRYVASSRATPSSLTILKVWRHGFYQRTTLLELGYSFYISHEHTSCPSAEPGQYHRILVIDLNGAHHLDVQFCACKEAPNWVDHYRQLLRMRWYPASFDRPKTAFTFDLLDTFHKLTLQGKLNLYDFYLSIMQKTDNCGRKKTIVSSSIITVMCCLTRARSLVPVPRDLKVCPSVAQFKANQTRRWRP